MKVIIFFLLCGGVMFSNHELEDGGTVFPHHFCKLGIPSLNTVVCSFVSFYVDIPHVHGDLCSITKQCLHKILVRNYHLTSWKFLSETHIKAVHPSWTSADGDEIVNAPLSCYIVKWRNRKVAITGIVQLSNLISSYNGNKK